MGNILITVESRAEIAALNNLCARLEVDATAAGRGVDEELKLRTDLELAALFCGYQLADRLGKRGQDRQDAAHQAAKLITDGQPGLPVVESDAAANFRVQVSRWLGLD
ncbi:hypothetical protein K388_07323 [Streptomyces sp. KhCrAH-43]|uniref:hypothetical protein n=1 Tax=unclassified Streptomyces TaxID=2593676 RepID=UPI00036DA1A6|nr:MULTISPECIES: hypothetical protein [unclassified Streptomyces]MYS32951.1 hypothetical protein [Streptomyces sp. SID4920]MYX64504.1 hypothetical protein [Streptomyces sp. SID8373]RAJ45709.1 hypothetical protein K388_07323 [Streptomyces sp. KhCrAH-43]